MIKKDGVYMMESAEILGDVKIGEHSSVWNKAVIRADGSPVRIGKNTNIQDMCVMHTEENIPLEIGDNVTIGHSAVIHCRRIGSNCIIGMGAMLLDDVEIGEYSIIAAGTVVTENKRIPPRSLVMGIPGKIVREINHDDIKRIENATQEYLHLARSHYEGQHKKIHS
ncbi:MAG: gamma carbonic anhydrase family protein [Deltaproteobacteria bacterium]|nr:MAG: gamma carbonic anhydrase family protein [Deltaproteobacteria bacterium]